MKLFLASSFDKVARLLPEKLSRGAEVKTVLLIANAADNETVSPFWVRSDREAFAKLGYRILDVDLRTISAEDLDSHLNSSDIIHFCGGSVLYLLSLIKERRFVSHIAEAVKSGTVVYSGTSAGSMIVAEDVSLSRFDREERPFIDTVKDYTGLSLVNFLIVPHSDSAEVVESNKQMVERLPEYKQAVIFLYDTQAVWVEDGKVEILSV